MALTSPQIKRWWLPVLLVLALSIRVGVVLSLDPLAPYYSLGGDNRFYLTHGYTLVTGQPSALMYVELSKLGVAPVYLLFNGFWQALLPSSAAISNASLADGLPAAYGVLYAAPSPTAVIAIRLAQAVMGTITCYLAYRLTRRLSSREAAGLLAAIALALSPAFVLETAVIGTETVYIFLLASALCIYTEAIDRPPSRAIWWGLAATGFLLGIASLTRAVLLLFPLGLALHLLLICTPLAALKRALWLLLVYAVVVSTWTVYNQIRYDRFIIAGEGLAAFFYIGATGWDGAQETDERLAADSAAAGLDPDQDNRQEVYTRAVGSLISSNPTAYLRRRVTEVAGAYLQPHGTSFFPGESLRSLTVGWLQHDRTITGLLDLTQADAFWPKLVVYIFHYVALIAGLAGMWIYRRRWRVALPLIGFVVYTTLVHTVLLALPRYIFPTEFVWWVFAAAALTHTWKRDARSSTQF